LTITTALKRHIRALANKSLTLARTMIPASSMLSLSPSRVLVSDQKIGTRHLGILGLTRMLRRAAVTVAQSRPSYSYHLRHPATAPGFYRLEFTCSQDSPRESLDVDSRLVRRTESTPAARAP